VFQLTFPGAPGIYYGDEVGLEGGDDPGCRGAMPWGRIEELDGISESISELTALRRRLPTLRTGDWRPLAADEDAIVFERFSSRSRYRIGINRGSSAETLSVPGAGELVWGAGGHRNDRFEVAGRSAAIVRA
jgi:glycosidase